MDPIALQLQSMLPLPNVPGNPLTNNYNATGAYVFGNDHADGKLNWNPTDKLSTFARFSILDYSATDASVFGAVGGEDVNSQGGQPGNYHGTTYSLTTSATYVLTPHLILDGYFAWENDNTAVEPFAIGQNLGQKLGIPGTNGPERYQSGWPTFYVTDYGSGSSSQALFGTTASQTGGFPYYRFDSQRQYVANLSWTKGSHDIRFGTEIQQQYIDNLQSGNAQGTFTFGTGPTELNGGPSGNQFNAYSTFLLGLDTSAADSRVFDSPAAEPANQNWYSGYIRDRWTISPKLTASLGVRWDYYGFPNAAVRGVASYNVATNQAEICGLGAVKPNCGTSMPKDLFSPRLGLAYRVTNTFVIRAGYGLDRDPFSMARSVLADYPTNISASYPAANSYGAYGTLEQGLPGITLPTITNGYLTSPTTVAMTVLPQGRMPWTYSQNWNITAQKELRGGFTTQVGYVANRTLQTISSDFGSTFNLNVDSQINTGTAGLPFYASEGRTAAVNYYGSHGNVMYNSMQASLSRRMTHGFRFNAAWTWSKDEVPVFNVAPTVTQYLYLNTRALAGSDRTNTLVLNGTWELPFGRGKAFLSGSKLGNALFGGWVFNALGDFYSGLPFSISTSGTSLNMTGATQLPIQVNPQVAFTGNIGGAYFNPLAFAPVTTANFGFVQPNNLRGPGEVDVDSGLTREFKVKERYTLQFRAEAFNFTNTPHFANPGGTVSNLQLNGNGTVKNLAGFAQVTAVANTGRDGIDQRQFQFSMRISF